MNLPTSLKWLEDYGSVEVLEREAERRRQVTDEISINADRLACKSFVEFVRRAWHILEPSNPYIHGWHIDAICMHLEAVTRGDITRLLINVPPGTAKSVIVSVLWPVWEWGPAGLPTMRYLTTSYHEKLTRRDSRRMLDLVQSEWYQARWPTKMVRAGAESFENDRQGWREAVPFSRLTGGRAHRLVIDDPHSTEGAESDADRAAAERIFRESAQSRMVEPKTSAIVIIMQRLHVNDIAGIALGLEGQPYVHLMLPMRFEVSRRCETKIGFVDPRTKEGELLFPARFPMEVINRDEKIMGSYATAGQHQQRPTLREGGLFKRKWFKIVDKVGLGVRWVRYWDLASTDEQTSTKAAYTVGLKLGKYPDGRYVIGDINRLRAEGHGVRKMIKNTAFEDGIGTEVGLPQDPGAAGKMVGQDMVLMLSGYMAKLRLESGDKLSRAEPVASQAEAGNVDIVRGDWNDAFFNEAEDFPGGQFKDQIDALSGAFGMLIGGNVFDVPEEYIAKEPLKQVPGHWPRVAAVHMDVNVVTCLWSAYDQLTDTLYIYDMFSVARVEIPVHASAIVRKTAWMPVLFDLEGAGRLKEDGIAIGSAMQDCRVNVMVFSVTDEVAMQTIADRLSVSSLKVFNNLNGFFETYRRMTRNEKGELVGDTHGVFKALGLITSGGMSVAITENRAASDAQGYDETQLARNPTTGY